MVVVREHLVRAKEVSEVLGLFANHAVHDSRGLRRSRLEYVVQDGLVSVGLGVRLGCHREEQIRAVIPSREPDTPRDAQDPNAGVL